MFLKKIKSVFFLFILSASFAQQKNMPLSYDADWLYSFTDNNNPNKQPLHSGFRPAIENSEKHFLSKYCFRNSMDVTKELDSNYIAPPRSKWLKRKLKQESLILVNDSSDKFYLTIDPLFNFQMSHVQGDATSSETNFYTNTRGFIIKSDIGKKFSIESSFYENQSTFYNYINDFVSAYEIVPGQGRWKRFKKNGYDYAMASGYLSYTPCKYINLQLGHGKHFVGEGYRSLLLSDNAFNYPYLRVTTTFGRFQYTNMYAVFMNLTKGTSVLDLGSEALFQKKAASFQYLSWAIHKRVQLGFFQGLIWQASDNKNRQNINLNYFNPLIFTNALVYSLNATNNVLLGSTLKLKFFENSYVYAQYVLDGYDKIKSVYNKQGFQIGFKNHQLLKIKNLSLLAEYNQVRPYTYAAVISEQSYTHYNQALAHPLGANFRELVSILSYRYKDFVARAKLVYARTGTDATSTSSVYPTPLTSTVGQNIFISDVSAVNGINSTNNFQNQGKEATIQNIDFSLAYIINPVNNMQVCGGINYIDRYGNSPLTIAYLSFKTSLSTIYYDF